MAKIKKAKEAAEHYLYFDCYENTTGGEVCEGQENDPWPSHEDEYREWYIKSCHTTKPKNYYSTESVKVDFEPVVGKSIWVTYVRYYDGGTFGRTCGYASILGVFENRDDAENVRKSVADGSYPGYKCWDGYFAGLESCETEQWVIHE